MSVVDLHPEDLLDKDARGGLSETERARLEGHLAHCMVCRFERQLRCDFADEFEGNLGIDGLGATGVLGIENPQAEGPESRLVVRRAPRRQRASAVWLLAAAVLLVGGAAAGMTRLREGPWVAFGIRTSLPARATDQATAMSPARASVHTSARDPQTTDLSEPATSAETPEPSAMPVAGSTKPLKVAHSTALVAPTRVVGPAELFDTANDARRRGDYRAVFDADQDLDARYPTSGEAQVLKAIVGRLLLDQGDPSGALAKFDSYLAAGGGELREEAMVGRATALDRLGRTNEATQAWTRLVATFRETPYAAHVKARLENVSGR